MSKDILDKLEIKNHENLSDNEFNKNTVLGMNKDLEKLKINDDFSNEDALNNEYTSKVTNSYIELNDVIKDDDRHRIDKDDQNSDNIYLFALRLI